VTLVLRHNIFAADGVRIKYRLDVSLFNIRRLQAVTKVTNDTIFDLQYADDAALPATHQKACSDSWMQSLLHTLAQDWSLTPKRRKSFTSPQVRRCPQLFTSAGINLASLNSSRTWEVSLPPHVISLRRFNIVLTKCPLPSGGCPSEFLRTVTFPHAPRWPSTTQSGSRHCSMHVRGGHHTVVTSEPSRPFTFGVFKLSCTCTGGTKYLKLRFAAEQAQHASRRCYSEDN